jgi:autophagy-related protein 17
MATSPPAQTSPGSSNESIWDKQPTLEQLVEHFLASKRSLSAISHVARAREIVDSSRQAVEENARLTAKNTFVRQTMDKQIEGLEAIKYGSTAVDEECHSDFQV